MLRRRPVLLSSLALCLAFACESGPTSSSGLPPPPQPTACTNIGTLHTQGLGVPRDIQVAARYFARGCEGMSIMIEQGTIVSAPDTAEGYAARAEALQRGSDDGL